MQKIAYNFQNVKYSSENINSLGGINFADLIINNTSVYKTIDQTMGQRGLKAEYSYSDLIRSSLLDEVTLGLEERKKGLHAVNVKRDKSN